LCIGAACAPKTGANRAASRSPELITAEEIVESQAASAYEAVLKLRAHFLNSRGQTSVLNRSAPELPNVYLDGVKYGPVSSLRNIPANQVAQIRLYRAWEASTRFGTGNVAGVIEVISRIQ
jgi:hypothetical protein